MENLLKGHLVCTFGHLLQIFTIWIMFLALVQGKAEDHRPAIDFNDVPVAAKTGHLLPNSAAFPIRQRRHIGTPKAGQSDFFLNFISTESLGETEFLFPQPHFHDRLRRAACWGGTGGGGGGGYPAGGGGYPGGGGGLPGGGGGNVDAGAGGTGAGPGIDVVERRRQSARKRQTAQRKKTQTKKKRTNKSKKYFVNERDNDDDAAEQNLRRRKRQANAKNPVAQHARTFADNTRGGWKKYRKSIVNGMTKSQMKPNVVRPRKRRQTELDDLGSGSSNGSNDFSEHARQVAEKIRGVWDNFMKTISQMTQQLKETFGQGNQGNQGAEAV